MVSEISLHSDLESELVTPRAYVLFYRRRGFSASTKADFDGLQVKSTGAADHLLNIPSNAESSTATATCISMPEPPTSDSNVIEEGK